jgi:uncharacterized protein (DUF4415 family)
VGKKCKYDWDFAKSLYDKGLSHTEIAKQIGATLPTVCQRASRFKWNKLLAIRQREKEEITQEWLREQGNDWLRQANMLLQRVTTAAASFNDPKTRTELRLDADVCRTLIAAGREHYGLDKEQASVNLGFSMSNGRVKLALSVGEHAQAVDVHGLPTEGTSVVASECVDVTIKEEKETVGQGGLGDEATGQSPSGIPISIAPSPNNVPPDDPLNNTLHTL